MENNNNNNNNNELYNIAFEKALLSSILFEPKLFEELSASLTTEDFYYPSYKNIYSSMASLMLNNMPIDEEFLKKDLLKNNCFDENAMLDILTANPISDVKAYLMEVKELSKLRNLLGLSLTMRKLTAEDGKSSAEVVDTIENQLQNLEISSNIDMPMTMATAIADFKTMTPPPLIKTGINSLDRMLCGGLESAQLIHIGGASNVGKTLLTKQILKNIAEVHKVLFFSFEMPKWKIAKQLSVTNFNQENYFITDSSMMGNDISDIARMIKRMKRQHDIRFIVIDSKMKITNNHFKGYNSVDRIAEIDATLARLCQELDIVIFMITQISKQDEQNGTMSGYGSALSDYEADMKILISFDKDATSPERKIEIKKNRQEVIHTPITLTLESKSLEFVSYVVATESVYVADDVNDTFVAPQPSYNDHIEVSII